MDYTVNVIASRRAAFLVAIVVAGGTLGTALAATNGPSPRPPTAAAKWGKLSSDLAQVLRAERRHGRGLAVARTSGLAVVGGRVRVVVVSRTSRRAVVSAVLGIGGKIEAEHATLVQALVPPGALARLTRAASVGYVRGPHRPVLLAPAPVSG
ncbi:MAG TPA: hypothetical protein VFX08_05750 [Gaiella sp.]|jgi:hypothetical protein|nr:hypothetical protein [Gaiella sp.]